MLTLSVLVAVSWAAIVVVSYWLSHPMIRRGDDVRATIAYRVMQVYARLMHGLRVEGREHIPVRGDRPILLVANHTAGVDPILLQAAIPYEVRWVMALDMRLPLLGPLWEFGRVIFVDRDKRDGTGVREAIRHLETGGVLGLFPEGHIERPPETLLPFQHGVGMMIRRTGAIVVPVVVTGTPEADRAWASLWQRSRSTVRFLPPVDYSAAKLKADQISTDLRRRFQEATGWPMLDEPVGLPEGAETC
ncbi:MAG: 1-acyl-sn-glycerol-3-phosphate acyltransferase [Phycisphaerales bacterium]|nr:1-acyl-sn-glycerol-3-phosphate acyltransferase [Phycisphaerales bacterium]